MSPEGMKLLEHVHGGIGWLAAASMAHPAWLLGRPQRRARAAVLSAVGLASLVGLGGVWVYGPYREHVRPKLFLEAPTYGWLFERKEHMGFAVVLLAWLGTVAYFAAERAEADLHAKLRRLARAAFAVGFLFALAVVALGAVVAARKTF